MHGGRNFEDKLDQLFFYKGVHYSVSCHVAVSSE